MATDRKPSHVSLLSCVRRCHELASRLHCRTARFLFCPFSPTSLPKKNLVTKSQYPARFSDKSTIPTHCSPISTAWEICLVSSLPGVRYVEARQYGCQFRVYLSRDTRIILHYLLQREHCLCLIEGKTCFGDRLLQDVSHDCSIQVSLAVLSSLLRQ